MIQRAAVLGILTIVIAACGGASDKDTGAGSAGREPNAGAGERSPSASESKPPESGSGSAPPPAAPPPPARQAPQPFPWNATCPAAPVDGWVPAPLPAGTLDDFRAYAADVRAKFVGHWKGAMDVYGGPHPVMFSFEANKHYSSVCLEVDCGATLHVATDNESPFKRYHLVDMTIDGVTSGTIDLAFPPQPAMGEDPNDPPWVPPSGTTVLQKVMIDESGNRLRFDLVSYLYDPPTIAHYELWRCP